MHNYTRRYFIDGKETTLSTTLKYIEIMLTHNDKQLNELPVLFIDEKIQVKEI